ncbi:MAG: hypothetical protein GW839_00150 [Flavobacteriales bacterium]|nr:hypothetical protein [Flavobacteriales bacterium]NCQ56693.1 hypothetical protein [Flavobacteriales bacterium]PIV93552.1 MAG: hypothetical protein COW44_08905 [Flavobacteriaceae bacterium CG17_big_fil_post_rev_8_21_14_2_50_33_15]
MKKQILLITIILGLMTLSCSKNDDQDSEYQGTWTGTFSGIQDNGTWTANIDSNGKLTGTTNSTVLKISLSLNGNVSSSGVFIATAGSASNSAEFNGKMSGTTGSGTWANTKAGINGTWSGNKQ